MVAGKTLLAAPHIYVPFDHRFRPLPAEIPILQLSYLIQRYGPAVALDGFAEAPESLVDIAQVVHKAGLAHGLGEVPQCRLEVARPGMEQAERIQGVGVAGAPQIGISKIISLSCS